MQIHAFELLFEGSLEIKLPTVWADEAAEVGGVREEKGRRNKVREDNRGTREQAESRETPCFFSNVLWLRRVKK